MVIWRTTKLILQSTPNAPIDVPGRVAELQVEAPMNLTFTGWTGSLMGCELISANETGRITHSRTGC
jgi:hypothetical protein